MAFPTDRRVVSQFGAIVDNVADIKHAIEATLQDTADGLYSADRLIKLVQNLKVKADALKQIKQDLKLNGGSTGSWVNDFNIVLTRTSEFLSWVRTNIPTHNAFLLLYTMDADFNLKAREFNGGTVAALNTELNKILQEIN